MKVVVTGASGNIGTSVVEALTNDPVVSEVVALARRSPEGLADVTPVAADVRSADLVGLFRGASTVVHLAWAFQPSHRPVDTWAVNVLGGIRVFEAAASAGVPSLIYSSSVGAYSPGVGRHVDESWPTHSLPTAAYGREKSYLERYLDGFECRQPSMRVVRIRPTFVFKRSSGAEQLRIFASRWVPRALVRPGRLPVVPVPAGLRFQAVHADDLAEAVRRVVVTDVRGAFNIAADPIIDAGQLQDLLGARPLDVPPEAAVTALAAAWRLRLVGAEDGLLRLLLSLPTMDTTRARQVLGWQPTRSGPEALREMLEGLADKAGEPTAPLQA